MKVTCNICARDKNILSATQSFPSPVYSSSFFSFCTLFECAWEPPHWGVLTQCICLLLKSISPQASQHPYNTAVVLSIVKAFLFKSSHPHVLVLADVKTRWPQACHAEKTQALISHLGTRQSLLAGLFFFFHFAKSYEILCFISFPKMIVLMTAALTPNLYEKADKRYRRLMIFNFTVIFSCSLWIGQMDTPSRQRQVATRTLIMGNGERMDAPFG